MDRPSAPTIRVVAAVTERDGKYLITQRRPTAVLPLLWEFPGGKKETLSLDANKGDLPSEVKTEAERIYRVSPKLANRYLAFNRKLRERKSVQTEMMLSKDKSQNDAMASQAAEEAKTNSYKAKKMVDLEYEQQLAEIEIAKEERLMRLKEPAEIAKHQRTLEVENIRAGAMIHKTEFAEEQKNKRSEKEATYQSEITDQKNNNTGPKNFREDEEARASNTAASGGSALIQ